MSVSIRRYGLEATVSAKDRGFKWDGNRGLAMQAARMVHENRWERGSYKSDELFLARQVAKKLGDCEVVDAKEIVQSLRDGWLQLLCNNLVPSPGKDHRYQLGMWNGISCSIQTRPKLSLKPGSGRDRVWQVSRVCFDNPDYLGFRYRVFNSKHGIDCSELSVAWERVVRICFAHFQPMPQHVMAVVATPRPHG